MILQSLYPSILYLLSSCEVIQRNKCKIIIIKIQRHKILQFLLTLSTPLTNASNNIIFHILVISVNSNINNKSMSIVIPYILTNVNRNVTHC